MNQNEPKQTKKSNTSHKQWQECSLYPVLKSLYTKPPLKDTNLAFINLSMINYFM